MSQHLYRIAYLSSGTRSFSEEELIELLRTARANNASQDITGILLYFDGSFMQVLEGGFAAVRTLYDKIARDPRHRGLFQLFAEPIDSRDFADWSMGFRRLNMASVVPEWEGFSRLMEQNRIPQEDLDRLSSQVRAFIQTFRATSRL